MRRVLKLYSLSSGTDCVGGNYDLGQKYLIFASEQPAQDHKLGEFFWYGWTDVVPKGALIIEAMTACIPGGKTADAVVKTALRELGEGRRPTQ